MKKAYGTNGKPLREIMSVSLEFQKEKRGRKRQKDYLKK